MPPWLRLLASFQFICGVACIAGSLLPQDSAPGNVNFTVILFPFLAGAVSVIAGTLLVVHEPVGLKLSLVVQAAQVLSLTASWRFFLLLGPQFAWLINSSGTGILAGFGGAGLATTAAPDGALGGIGMAVNFQVGLFAEPLASASWAVGINLVALVAAVRLWRTLRTISPVAPPDARDGAA